MKIIFTLCASAFCATIWAQQADSTLNQSMTLEREFSPIITDANKVDRQPAIEEILPNHVPSTYAGAVTSQVHTPEVGLMAAGQVVAEPEPFEAGHLDLSAGNYWNTRIDAGYRVGEFKLQADGFFTNGAIKGPYPMNKAGQLMHTTWDSNLLSGRISGAWNHAFLDGSEVNAHLSAAGTADRFFNYGAKANGKDELLYFQKYKELRQAFGQLQADLGYQANRWDMRVYFNHVGLKYPDTFENSVGLNANWLIANGNNWLLSAALATSMDVTEEKTYFSIKPEAELSYIPDSYLYRRTYVRAGIGTYHPDLYKIMERMPIATVFADEYKTPFDVCDVTLGWEDSEQGWFQYGASIQLKQTNHQTCVFTLSADETFFQTAGINAQPGLSGAVGYDDCFTFGAEAHFNYEYNRFFGAKAKINYTHFSELGASFGNPSFTTDLHLLSHPKRLTFDLSLLLGLDRKMQFFDLYSTERPEIDLDNIVNLGFRTDYAVSNTLSIYLYGCNLLNRRYQLWAGVPAQRINLHAGFNWKF